MSSDSVGPVLFLLEYWSNPDTWTKALAVVNEFYEVRFPRVHDPKFEAKQKRAEALEAAWQENAKDLFQIQEAVKTFAPGLLGETPDWHHLDESPAPDPFALARQMKRVWGAVAAAVPSNSTVVVGTDGGGDKVGQDKRTKGIPREEAEALVRDWLAKHAKANPDAVTRDAVAAATGVSAGGVSNTDAWTVFSKRREEKANPGPRVIPLTDAMHAVVPADCQTPDELAALVEEQRLEKEKEEKLPLRHKRRHEPS